MFIYVVYKNNEVNEIEFIKAFHEEQNAINYVDDNTFSGVQIYFYKKVELQ